MSANTFHVAVAIRLPEVVRNVLQGVAAYMREHGCVWRVQCVDADGLEEMLRRRLMDGAIVRVALPDYPMSDTLRSCGVPLVNVVHDCHKEIPSVLADEEATGRAAAQHLIGRGYRHFAYVGFDSPWSRGRHQGFTGELRASGYSTHDGPECATALTPQFLDEPRSADAHRQWLSTLPTPIAIFACSDYTAATMVEICSAAGLRVPADAAVIGVGNLITTCEMTSVPLSSVGVDFPGIGYHAARFLEGLLRGERPPAAPYHVAPLGVTTRRSTDAFMFEDENLRAAARIIHDRAAVGLTMKDLLRQVPVSRKWLDSQFKLHLGSTPSHLMRDLRLQRIRELLVSTDLSIEQIAMICRISRRENLIRLFRDAYGVPPSVYRAHRGLRSSSAF